MAVSCSAAKALPSLRVLEVASLILGPYCGNPNASRSATVIKANLPIPPA